MTDTDSKGEIQNAILAILRRMGCNPISIEDLGYKFGYAGYECLYFPQRDGENIVRVAIPKLADIGHAGSEKIRHCVNMANSMVTESKFFIMGDEVWLIYERFVSKNEEYVAMTEHILDNLKRGAELFHRFS